MTEILCKIIPLYKYVIYYEADEVTDHMHEHVIVSDTLHGLSRAIAKQELNRSMADCDKSLAVDNFLLMPLSKQRECKKFNLYDIDEQDIYSYSATVDEQFFQFDFEGDEPKPVDGFFEALEHMAVDPVNNDIHEGELMCYLADAVYQSHDTHDMIKTNRRKLDERNTGRLQSGEQALAILRSRNGETE